MNWPHPLTQLGDISVAEFVRDYWQQKPLLIRQALPDSIPTLTPEELAGLSLEDSVESRLVQEFPQLEPLTSDWQVTQGPLAEDAFSQLGDAHWTLLVQAVDQLVPEVAALLNRFRFLPNWRLDDVMVSYAADKGSVGPHFDYYDVFLLQTHGQRLWRLGQNCDNSTPLRPDLPLQLLTAFDQQQEFLLDPGDMLYLPPQLAHWGIAQGPCMTYSVGFRAPSYEELLLDFSEEVAAELVPHQRLCDTSTRPATSSGEISDADVDQTQKILLELLGDRARIAQWLGRYGTSARRNPPEIAPESFCEATIASTQVVLNPRIRSAFYRCTDGRAQLYLAGNEFACSDNLARALTAYRPFAVAGFPDDQDQTLLATLCEHGWLLENP